MRRSTRPRDPSQASNQLGRIGVGHLLKQVGGKKQESPASHRNAPAEDPADDSRSSTSDEEEQTQVKALRSTGKDDGTKISKPNNGILDADEASRYGSKTRRAARNPVTNKPKDEKNHIDDSAKLDSEEESESSSSGQKRKRSSSPSANQTQSPSASNANTLWGDRGGDEVMRLYNSQNTKRKTYGGSNSYASYKRAPNGNKKPVFKHSRDPPEERSEPVAKFITPRAANVDTNHEKPVFKVPRSAELGEIDQQNSQTTSQSSIPTSKGPKTRDLVSPGNHSSSPADSPPTSPIASQDAADIHLSSSALDATSADPKCPVCHISVDPALLKDFASGHRLRLKDALAFCTAHKRHTAQSQWSQRGYPNIDWTHLDKRLRRHHGTLHAILDHRSDSRFRADLDAKVASGRFRNALRNPDAAGGGAADLVATPGYYGSKGARRMMEHVMGAFAAKLRKVAAGDRLFSATGVSGFVQAVLVPEVAVLLVMDDLGVDWERAREVLRESAEMGELLNPEEEERFEMRDESDEEGGGLERGASDGGWDA